MYTKKNVQISLGQLVVLRHQFRVYIDRLSICKPIYMDSSLQHLFNVNDIIGHIVYISAMPHLIISKVKRVRMYQQLVVSEPILHSIDTRSVKDLLVSELYLSPKNICCYFVPE